MLFEFEGDLWEDEDQRNWTDASFKTYCTPLALGFPHRLEVGSRIAQQVTVSVQEPPVIDEPSAPSTLRVGAPLGRSLPTVGLAASADGASPTERELELLRALKLDHLRVEARLDSPGWADALSAALVDRARLDIPLEVAVFLLQGHANELAQLASALDGVPIARVLAFPADARTATPNETTPAALIRLVRAALGEVPVAGGTDMNFCELNRSRPDADAMDGISYSIVGQIHAFDDISLVETLEAQGETAMSAGAFAQGRPISVSPVTMKRRFNAHATAEEAELGEGELPESVDPRQLSLLGAAWTAGSVKYLAEAGVASVTYFETTGWRGVLERESGSELPARFPSQPGQVFPLYHVLADLGDLKGAELVECRSSDPLTVVGLAARRDGRMSLLVGEPQAGGAALPSRRNRRAGDAETPERKHGAGPKRPGEDRGFLHARARAIRDRSDRPMRTAVVTGAGTGIGAATAEMLAAQGCAVVLVGRREDKLREVAEGLKHSLVVAADLEGPEAPQRIIEERLARSASSTCS